MKCMKCGRPAYMSTTSEAIELGFGLLVIRNIPCYKCEECDEISYTGDVVMRIESLVAEAKRLMHEIRVIDYTKAA
ncbi:MAG: YgiT-type zinc finger protein [Clostridiales bacterium]|nr:YgiT-type zinc finger protein [Clostridiales bacterium]